MIHTYIYICYIYICIHIYMWVHVYTCTYIYIYIYVNVYLLQYCIGSTYTRRWQAWKVRSLEWGQRQPAVTCLTMLAQKYITYMSYMVMYIIYIYIYIYILYSIAPRIPPGRCNRCVECCGLVLGGAPGGPWEGPGGSLGGPGGRGVHSTTRWHIPQPDGTFHNWELFEMAHSTTTLTTH